MILLGVLSLVFRYLRCSNSVAMLIVGLTIGAAELHRADLLISDELIMALLELGAVLQLFDSGVSIDFSNFDKYWRQVTRGGAAKRRESRSEESALEKELERTRGETSEGHSLRNE